MTQEPADPASAERRRFVLAGVAGLAAAAIGAGPQAGAASPEPRIRALDPRITPRRIAFGSCADQDKPQPVWDAINALEPDLFIFLGDNIYGDTRDMNVLRAKYEQLAAKPGFRTLRERTPILAIWDDHDYGENDGGADYPMREESRRIFCDFWGEPADSPRRTRDGIYHSVILGPPGHRVQIVLPDLRFNRTPLTAKEMGATSYRDWAQAQIKAGNLLPGPHARNPAQDATMLGEPQWRWLEGVLREPAELRIVASSLQVLADAPGWEGWINYARDHQRLIQTLRTSAAEGVVFISGDTHYAELSRLDLNVPYPLWDLTSSGLTEVWPYMPPNANRVSEMLAEQNFGLIEIAWEPEASLTLQVRDVKGQVRIAKTLLRRELQASA